MRLRGTRRYTREELVNEVFVAWHEEKQRRLADGYKARSLAMIIRSARIRLYHGVTCHADSRDPVLRRRCVVFRSHEYNLHSAIGVVAKRTGISEDVVRDWLHGVPCREACLSYGKSHVWVNDQYKKLRSLVRGMRDLTE